MEGLTAIIDAEDFSVSDLKGLLKCKTLRKLCIHYWSLSSPLVANDVEAMAASWPTLEMLHLLTTNPFTRPHTPLSILTTIAQCMKSTLTDLGLELFADETVQLTTSLEAVGSTTLRHLTIGNSSIVEDGHEPYVANYLASICPHSVEISWRSRSILGIPDGSLDPWNKVGALFKHSCSGARGIAPRNP
ncbi:hypothetical protein M407DRAFT_246430 [Tulasnella calospora MUT 4182]|uniref:F-box domain-containing protein n=1 Tax=Tulasnella calospora MUT 4182 TaxID=1051891 RepID=A0A0C3LAW0_9AGAM|nr:hypothetical protein M407DRAFT_246430 [Tulasnella calospora MUT 4182]